MGLDLHPARRLAPGEWDYDSINNPPSPQWSYGGFDRFRKRLAEAEGFDLHEMVGFSAGTFDQPIPGQRSWDGVDTSLKPLLDHSDCDGEMTPKECAEVLPRLYGIITQWSLTDPEDYDVRAGRELCCAMEMCVKDGLDLLFR